MTSVCPSCSMRMQACPNLVSLMARHVIGWWPPRRACEHRARARGGRLRTRHRPGDRGADRRGRGVPRHAHRTDVVAGRRGRGARDRHRRRRLRRPRGGRRRGAGRPAGPGRRRPPDRLGRGAPGDRGADLAHALRGAEPRTGGRADAAVGGVRPLRRRSPRSTPRPSSTSRPSCSATRTSCRRRPRARSSCWPPSSRRRPGSWPWRRAARPSAASSPDRADAGSPASSRPLVIAGLARPYDAGMSEPTVGRAASSCARRRLPTPSRAACCTGSAGARPTGRSSTPACSRRASATRSTGSSGGAQIIDHRPPLLAVHGDEPGRPSRWPVRPAGTTRRRRTSSMRSTPARPGTAAASARLSSTRRSARSPCYAWVLEDNERARAFYAKQRMVPDGMRKRYDPLDAWELRVTRS